MKLPILAAALALAAGAALAQPLESDPPTRTILCLDVAGRSEPAICKVAPSRLDLREDICVCAAGMRVETPVCARGETPPAESARFERVRRLASRDGSLIGDLYEGRRMCRAPRRP